LNYDLNLIIISKSLQGFSLRYKFINSYEVDKLLNTIKEEIEFYNKKQINSFNLNATESELNEKYLKELHKKIKNAIGFFNEKQSDMITELNKIGIALSSEGNLDRLLDMILFQARKFANADAGTLYLKDATNKKLVFQVVQNDTLSIRMGGESEKIKWPPLELFKLDGSANNEIVSTLCALTSKTILIDDVYDVKGFNFEGAKKFDAMNNYRSTSMLVIPMKNHKNHIVGVLQLLNKKCPFTNKIISFSKDDKEITLSLTSQAAVAITRVKQEEFLKYQKQKIETHNEILREVLFKQGFREEKIKDIANTKIELDIQEEHVLRKSHREKISAKNYILDVSEGILDELFELEELESELNEEIENSNLKFKELIVNIASIILKYCSTIKMLIEFEDLSFALKSMAILLTEIKDDNLNEKQKKKILLLLEAVAQDLAQWRRTIFIDKNAIDIHYLDSSLQNSCVQIELEVRGNDDCNEDNLELF
jgi:GAF domain-containing protein